MAGEQTLAKQQPHPPPEKYPPSMEGMLRHRVDDLEAALRAVVETSHGAGREHWDACEMARKILAR